MLRSGIALLASMSKALGDMQIDMLSKREEAAISEALYLK
jgi:hypothetical protein